MGMKAKRRIAAAISILVATAGLVLVSAPAALADYSTAPRATWSATSGRVYAIERVGNAIVIGGTFTTLRAPTGNQTVTRNRLAAFDAVTGDLLPWNPGANGDVRDLQANADGTGVFVGGAFTNIAGVAKNRLALLRLDTGANVASFTTNVNNQAVLSLARSGDVLFLGGTFTQVNGAARQRLAAVSATTGANVAGWTGSANARVNSIVLSPDGTRLYAGGQFTTLSGETRNFVGAVATTNGAAVAWTPPIPCTDTQNPCYVHDLDADALRVYGAVGGPGGRVSAWDTSTAQRRWAAYTDGDVQAIAVDGTQVYAGGHYAPNFGQQPRTGIVALNSATGGVLPFNPTLVIGELGVWEINPGPDYLRIGGGFTSVNGVGARARYAEFPALNPVDDTTPPTAPTGLGTVLVTDDLVTIDWNASTDDNAVTGYRVLRDGNVVAQTGVTTHTDRDLSPNTTYTYRVQATDAAGNWSNQSSALNVTTAAPSNALVRIGSTWRYLSNGSDQGTAWRGVGFNDSSWSAGPAQLGFGDSDESTVISPLGLTHYFRRTFTANPGSMSGLELRLLRDDGAIVYLNGVEVMRSNMPSGTVNYRTQASSDVNGAAENTFYPQSVPVSRLVNGTNTIAVEIHNRSGSPDVSFDLELRPTGSAPRRIPRRRLRRATCAAPR
ncbi:MAG: hypothetical protein HZY75_04715 [Nocardioidaceae bacterium]|nr:MAG: hypothetical protein HZY75_04715 [Nocardioidaceae bacterium]